MLIMFLFLFIAVLDGGLNTKTSVLMDNIWVITGTIVGFVMGVFLSMVVVVMLRRWYSKKLGRYSFSSSSSSSTSSSCCERGSSTIYDTTSKIAVVCFSIAALVCTSN